MKINALNINSDEEVIVKIIKEVLVLFKVTVAEGAADYAAMSIDNATEFIDGRARVKTILSLEKTDGSSAEYVKERLSNNELRILSEQRRLIKLNLYDILSEITERKPAPWGIMHGVRPTKIVHKFIKRGLSCEAIVDKLQQEYAVSVEKAVMLTKLAYKQMPFLEKTGPDKVSVYIGIPFCLSRCLYCSFPAYVLPTQEKLEQFMTVFRQDLEQAAQSIRKHRLSVQNIYIGGGTPTSLPNKLFDELLDIVCRQFKQPETKEFTVEAGRPDSVDDAKIQSMMVHGVNRVSVNPQTMQQKTLNYIGRKHTVEAIIELFGKFRQAGMENINMDLIIGLPGETLADVDDTLKQVTALKPDDLTLHALALKRGSRLKEQLAEHPLPADETVRAMFELALDYVHNEGMEPYYLYRQGYMSGDMENVGCAKKGAEGLYNIQIMEENQTIIGVGPAATTKVIHFDGRPMATAFHAKDLTTYLDSVDKYIEKRTKIIDDAFSREE